MLKRTCKRAEPVVTTFCTLKRAIISPEVQKIVFLTKKPKNQVFNAHITPMVPEKQFRNIAWQQFTQFQHNHSNLGH